MRAYLRKLDEHAVFVSGVRVAAFALVCLARAAFCLTEVSSRPFSGIASQSHAYILPRVDRTSLASRPHLDRISHRICRADGDHESKQ
eukprot:4379518-Pleurochrysis_carterae.AAC.1